MNFTEFKEKTIPEVHSPLAAIFAARHGFRRCWASGFAISSLFGRFDRNELSWSEMSDWAGRIAESADVELIVDGDNGHGDEHIFARFVRRLEQNGCRGVCVEDKKFPKLNSFVAGRHELESSEAYLRKLSAALQVRRSASFLVIARTEALICGAGPVAAAERLYAYDEAGADALFLHSNRSDAEAIRDTLALYKGSKPIFLAPTTYLQALGGEAFLGRISGLILANQGFRASCRAIDSSYEAMAGGNLEFKDAMPLDELFSRLEERFPLPKQPAGSD